MARHVYGDYVTPLRQRAQRRIPDCCGPTGTVKQHCMRRFGASGGDPVRAQSGDLVLVMLDIYAGGTI
ncbi:MAG: hypothetical protein AUJ02_11660 [Chloroflexi bacterium 13_1_40CM_3_65_12]|nr:MAG: hypothetical protein AUH40_10405 [Chloroflexi bacterium 13_1_40CM_65_17]OLC68387.1 MAG: hypothetical protein AUH69_01650 [Actinobacteria bacterium 13_1_40CM_4_65_12]OLD23246.1 MAG: hypothetical protein AUJ02_11660 [Chloroflexi bacterium 13_1_40CM_3_65_12]OLD48614.1 MAG: hypothetical protein AUI42_11790 [Actinobacteria bacterium 13_1_40CM_2_65_8]